jgi:hypothetical protein
MLLRGVREGIEIKIFEGGEGGVGRVALRAGSEGHFVHVVIFKCSVKLSDIAAGQLLLLRALDSHQLRLVESTGRQLLSGACWV